MTADRGTLRAAVAGMRKPVERVAGGVAIVNWRSRLIRRGIKMVVWCIGDEMRRILPEVLQIMDGSRSRDHRPDGRDERQNDADEAPLERSKCETGCDHAAGGYINGTRGRHRNRVPPTRLRARPVNVSFPGSRRVRKE
jgi:hypothetical protein